MLLKLMEIHEMIVRKKNAQVKRYLYNKINWDANAICIFGARGTGKTTMMIQHYYEKYNSSEKALYISADHIYVAAYGLYEIADAYFKQGGRALYIDEIHKYFNWTTELKNIIDVYPDKQIIISGSSTIALNKSKADLSRRVLYYELMGLSFREFLNFDLNKKFTPFTLSEVIEKSNEISTKISSEITVCKAFRNYLECGYYPFFLEGKTDYIQRLSSVIEKVISEDIIASFNLSQPKLPVIKKLLLLVSGTNPFIPNIDRISSALRISREYVYKYLLYLEKAGFIMNIRKAGSDYTATRKPAKIYLQNTGLLRALSEKPFESLIGNVQEIFFANQLSVISHVSIPSKGDFLINDKYCFEIGGKNKKHDQIKDLENSYLALDQIEVGFKKTIPLYLFGFLY